MIIKRKEDDKIAIAFDGDYFLLGGGIEKKESKEQALKRELLEETGFIIKNKKKFIKLTAYVNKGDRGPLKVKTTIYIAEFDRKICEPIEKDHKILWINVEEYIGKLYHEYQNYVLEKYWQLNK